MTARVSRRRFVARGSALGAGLAGGAITADRALAQARARSLSDSVWRGDAPMHSADAPISIKSSTLVVNDPEAVAGFYQRVLGFELLRGDGETRELGAGGETLLVLRKDMHARRQPHEAGLFHNALLLPDRAALGRWIRHATDSGVRFTGMADHDVSEAVYLDDPEGNGIEVYADRPAAGWTFKSDGQLHMHTVRLDVEGVLAAADGPWRGAPENTVIGHVHLQVGDIDALHRFMTERLGQDLMAHEGSAAFYASGGYHHHFAGNIWNSRDAGVRSPDSTGLAGINLRSDGARLPPGEVTDPWGNQFTVEAS